MRNKIAPLRVEMLRKYLQVKRKWIYEKYSQLIHDRGYEDSIPFPFLYNHSYSLPVVNYEQSCSLPFQNYEQSYFSSLKIYEQEVQLFQENGFFSLKGRDQFKKLIQRKPLFWVILHFNVVFLHYLLSSIHVVLTDCWSCDVKVELKQKTLSCRLF